MVGGKPGPRGPAYRCIALTSKTARIDRVALVDEGAVARSTHAPLLPTLEDNAVAIGEWPDHRARFIALPLD